MGRWLLHVDPVTMLSSRDLHKGSTIASCGRHSPVRYVLKIYFFIESGRKMIQFKIQFKTKSKIFIQKNIHSIESRIFNKIIHSQKMRKSIQNSKIRTKSGF